MHGAQGGLLRRLLLRRLLNLAVFEGVVGQDGRVVVQLAVASGLRHLLVDVADHDRSALVGEALRRHRRLRRRGSFVGPVATIVLPTNLRDVLDALLDFELGATRPHLLRLVRHQLLA